MKLEKALPLHKTSFKHDRETQIENSDRIEVNELQRKYKQLLSQLCIGDRLVSLAEKYCTSYAPLKVAGRKLCKNSGDNNCESAVLVLSDTHIGKKVHSSQTLGFGNYNFPVFADRLHYLEDRVRSILADHVNPNVDELVIFMLGDMLDGALQHPKEIISAMTVFDQFYAGAHCIAQAIRNIAQDVPRVKVYTTVGNHCVDEQTEILTRRGWLKVTAILPTDECLGLESDGETARWQPIKSVIKEKAVDRMVTIRNRQFSFRGTEHHRFYYKILGHPMLNNARWSEIEALPIRVPSAARLPRAGLSDLAPYADLCAAILTDGSISKEGAVRVYQIKNSDWIEAAFKKAGLAFKLYKYIKKTPKAICGVPYKGGPTVLEKTYALSAEDSRAFLKKTGLKKGEIPSWVWELSEVEFRSFLHTLLAGDGSYTTPASATLYGKSEIWLSEVQALCVTHGIPAALSSYMPRNNNHRKQWKLRLRFNENYTTVAGHTTAYEEPTGEAVWCVTTETENFFCRREGKGYFTGNSRMMNQRKMPSEQRYSNFDHFLYAMVKQMLKEQHNVDFRLDYQPFCYVDVKGTKILGMHGDHLKGGDKQMGVPIHSISRQVSGLTQLYEAKGQEAPHLWLMGHLHRPMELPTIKGEWLVNGAFPGDDNYALTLASSCEPMQLFFGIHPKYRKSWEYKLKLQYAPVAKTLPYTLPKELHEMLIA